VAALPGDDFRDLIRQVREEDHAAWTTFIERFPYA